MNAGISRNEWEKLVRRRRGTTVSVGKGEVDHGY
jgi:hypothetical protein